MLAAPVLYHQSRHVCTSFWPAMLSPPHPRHFFFLIGLIQQTFNGRVGCGCLWEMTDLLFPMLSLHNTCKQWTWYFLWGCISLYHWKSLSCFAWDLHLITQFVAASPGFLYISAPPWRGQLLISRSIHLANITGTARSSRPVSLTESVLFGRDNCPHLSILYRNVRRSAGGGYGMKTRACDSWKFGICPIPACESAHLDKCGGWNPSSLTCSTLKYSSFRGVTHWSQKLRGETWERN